MPRAPKGALIVRFTTADVALIRAAASLAAHAPGKMRAGHMAPRLEELARRLVVPDAAPERSESATRDLPRAA
jgi:hypothetical protein